MARPATGKQTTRHVALLRGVNVGGKNKLPMAALAALFTKLGCASVSTYIQSGNVVFAASDAVARKLAPLARAALQKEHGLDVPVVVRSAAELDGVVGENPFLERGAAEDTLHVAFLADAPTAERAARLDPARSPPDAFALRRGAAARELYLHLPNGVARSKLTNAYFDATLGTTSTIRNWRTVLALAALVRG